MLRLATLSSMGLLHCSAVSAPGPLPTAPSRADTPAATSPAPALEGVLCAGRARCALAARQVIDSLPRAELLTLRLADPAGTPSDEERCNRREYWHARPGRNVLLTADCETQWGADSQGPAELQLVTTRLTIRYVEFQANDHCELVHAAIDLASVTIERHARQTGTVVADRCQPLADSNVPAPPTGDGTSARPLVVLHRP